jgi:methionine-rich copper-binding protein CopC
MMRPRSLRAATLPLALSMAGALLMSPLLVATPASAHNALAGSTPAAGSTLTTAPTSVTLTFEEPPLSSGMAVVVTAPDKSRVSPDSPVLTGSDVVTPLAPLTASGTYSVAWRVVADDGHPVTGTFTFTLDLGAATSVSPSATASATSSAVGTVATTTDGSSSSTPVGWIVAGAVALAVLVGAVALVSRRRSA